MIYFLNFIKCQDCLVVKAFRNRSPRLLFIDFLILIIVNLASFQSSNLLRHNFNCCFLKFKHWKLLKVHQFIFHLGYFIIEFYFHSKMNFIYHKFLLFLANQFKFLDREKIINYQVSIKYQFNLFILVNKLMGYLLLFMLTLIRQQLISFSLITIIIIHQELTHFLTLQDLINSMLYHLFIILLFQLFKYLKFPILLDYHLDLFYLSLFFLNLTILLKESLN